VQWNHDALVATETPPVADAAVGIGIVPVHLSEEDERAGDEGASPKIVDTFGDTGMIAMLGQYQAGAGIVVPWAPTIDNGTIRGTAIDEVWGVSGVALSGVGEGGGGKGTGIVLDHVHTDATAMGTGHGHLERHHVGPICHLPIVTAISCYRIPPEIIQRVVRGSLGRFRACYADGLKKDPTLAGRVVTKFVIARDGSVAAASDGSSDLADQDVRACVQRAFMSLEFPANPDNVATVTYPIVMSPEE
jgi:hypothetical protein